MLLKHFEIKNRLMSHHKFNEHGTTAAVVGGSRRARTWRW
jgi:16S rRNA (cytidine1402-2'-O)-methyltransferase